MSVVFAGLDWASRSHAVCVVDERGSVCRQWDVPRTMPMACANSLHQLHALHAVRIAIERPSGLLVDVLVEAGFEVVPIHPNAVKASRPRYRSHGGKSDASRRVPAGRPAAHRRAPLQVAGRAVRRDPSAARAGARPR